MSIGSRNSTVSRGSHNSVLEKNPNSQNTTLTHQNSNNSYKNNNSQ